MNSKQVFEYFFILLLVFFVPHCGKRTAPVPYAEIEKKLNAVDIEKVNYLANDLFVSWQMPRSDNTDSDKIKEFIINFYPSNPECLSCNKKNQVIIPMEFQATSNNGFTLVEEGNEFYLLIQEFRVEKLFGAGVTTFTIFYRNEEGLRSVESSRIHPKKPIPIPEPSIVIKRQFARDNTEKNLLFVQWNPSFEVSRHVTDNKGNLIEKSLNYGINLYLKEFSESNFYQEPINPIPLNSGLHYIETNQKTIYAAHVDRFGNESNRIKISKSDE